MLEDKNQILARVNNTLEKIRPYLLADGGDINVIELTDDNKLVVDLVGACGHCPFSFYTLKAGVEQAIKQDIPEIQEVITRQQE